MKKNTSTPSSKEGQQLLEQKSLEGPTVGLKLSFRSGWTFDLLCKNWNRFSIPANSGRPDCALAVSAGSVFSPTLNCDKPFVNRSMQDHKRQAKNIESKRDREREREIKRPQRSKTWLLDKNPCMKVLNQPVQIIDAYPVPIIVVLC